MSNVEVLLQKSILQQHSMYIQNEPFEPKNCTNRQINWWYECTTEKKKNMK